MLHTSVWLRNSFNYYYIFIFIYFYIFNHGVGGILVPGYYTSTGSSWDVSIVDKGNYNITTALAPYSQYFLRIRVKPEREEEEQYATEAAIAVGEGPEILFVTASPISLFQTTSQTGSNYGWFTEFETQDEGVVQIMIYAKFSSFSASNVQNTTVTFNVFPFRRKIADGEYTNLIGETFSKNSAILSTLPTITISSFSAPSLSQTSLAHIIVVDPSSNYFVFSDSNFREVEIVHPNIDEFTAVCTVSTGVKSGFVSFDRVLLNTAYGILFGSLSEDDQTMVWRVDLPVCITSMTVLPLFFSFEEENLQYTFAFGESLAVYLSIHPTESSFEQLLDTEGRTLGNFFNNIHSISTTPTTWQVMHAAANDVFANTYLFLVNCSSSSLFSSGLVLDSKCCGGTWEVLFIFPTNTPSLSFSAGSSFLDILTSDATYTGNELKISGMQFLRGGATTDLFLWGSSLLYSPDKGDTVFMLKNFTDTAEYVTSFVSSVDGSYVFLTNTHQLYFGQILSPLVVPVLISAVNASSDFVRHLFFDPNSDLYSISTSLNNDLSVSSVLLDSSLVNSVSDTIDLLSVISKLECSYQSITFGFNNDPAYSRSTLPLSATGYPPAIIFIDYLVNYTFTLTITPNIPLYSISASFRFPQTKYPMNLYLDFEFTRVEDYSTSLVYYTVTVKDLGHFGSQLAPGEDLQPSPLQIRVSDANLECGASTTQSVLFYTGCPPGSMFTFSPDLSCAEGAGCKVDGEIPSFYFGNKFYPVFEIVDTFINNSKIYEGLFSFTIIGGGKKLDSIKNFTTEEITKYNSGKDTIWVPVNSLENGGMYNTTGVFWLCTAGSPCGMLFPDYPHTPSYYFLIRATTLNSNSSYCAFSTTFILHLHTINLNLGIYIAIFFSTLVVLFVALGLGFYLVTKYKRAWLLGIKVDR